MTITNVTNTDVIGKYGSVANIDTHVVNLRKVDTDDGKTWERAFVWCNQNATAHSIVEAEPTTNNVTCDKCLKHLASK